jgi:hypothetical protein
VSDTAPIPESKDESTLDRLGNLIREVVSVPKKEIEKARAKGNGKKK